jgi:crotonobetainyl-CoA:carnitine CoA-transferase CaiB-like acyl-CoA transferase
MEKWGLGPEQFKETNSKLVYARISGFGQTGPYSKKPGYASVTEGISGFRYVNGIKGEAPVRPNLSIGDTIAGIHTALGIAMALLECNKSGSGQVVDVALYEAMFNLMEGVVPEYDGAGVIRQPSGSTVTGIVPTNTYKCSDEKFVVIGGNGDAIYKRLMIAAGHPKMATDPAMANNAGRVIHEKEIDAALASWCASIPAKAVIDALEAVTVPVGPIYSVADMMQDEHFQARGLFEEVEINGKPLKIPAMIPRLEKTPGSTRWPGPKLGSHTDEVLRDVLGLDDAAMQDLSDDGII